MLARRNGVYSPRGQRCTMLTVSAARLVITRLLDCRGSQRPMGERSEEVEWAEPQSTIGVGDCGGGMAGERVDDRADTVGRRA